MHRDYILAILNELERIKDNESIEISFHPGFREDWRIRQVEILTNPELKKALKEANVELVTYNGIKDIK